MAQAQIPLSFAPQQSGNYQRQKGVPKINVGQLKIPELQFASLSDPNVNFQHEACKLIQANTILTQLIKEAVIEKYTLSEKIHVVLEQIKKLEAKNAIK